MSAAPLLEVRDLHVAFAGEEGDLPAVRGVSLEVGVGETVALVGESGCGKSVTALALLRLLGPTARVRADSLCFRGRDLAGLAEEEIRRVRGAEIGMIFQEPMTSLNPVFRIGDQIGEVLELHRGLSRADARRAAASCGRDATWCRSPRTRCRRSAPRRSPSSSRSR